MKEIIIQVRLFIAELFLGWALSVAPLTREGCEIVVLAGKYFANRVKEQARDN